MAVKTLWCVYHDHGGLVICFPKHSQASKERRRLVGGEGRGHYYIQSRTVECVTRKKTTMCIQKRKGSRRR